MRIPLTSLLLLLSLAVVSTATQAGDSAQATNQNDATYEEVAALLAQSSNQRNEIDNATATIRSESDLHKYLQAPPIARTPLGNLSPSARRQFLASLTFNDKGLTGFDYRALSNELSASEIYRVLSLFGMQHVTAQIPGVRVNTPLDAAILRQVSPQFCGTGVDCLEDHENYKCESTGSCKMYNGYICTSNC